MFNSGNEGADLPDLGNSESPVDLSSLPDIGDKVIAIIEATPVEQSQEIISLGEANILHCVENRDIPKSTIEIHHNGQLTGVRFHPSIDKTYKPDGKRA